jgi:hypothetical protein
MFDSLFITLSGSSTHEISSWASWHARCMVLGWGVLMPVGALIARYYKITARQDWPRVLDNKFWWHSHRVLQWSGVALVSIGAWLAWGLGGSSSAAARIHTALGWAVLFAGWFQVLGGLARGTSGGPKEKQIRGDHYDMTPRRLAFERIHKSLGWIAILTAVLVVIIGLVMVDAPRWMLLALLAWWGLIVFAFARLQKQGRCIDTYQAIWGPDLQHPGNQKTPIGWGVRRLSKNA